MIAAVVNFFRQNIWATCVSIGLAAASSSATYIVTIQQNRVDRFEASMIAEYQAVASSKRDLYAALDRFSMALATGKAPDEALVIQMNDKMGDLRERVDVFNVGLAEDDREKLRAVRDALADMKIEISRAKTKSDLQYVAGTMAVFEAAYQKARPIVEKKMGVPMELLQG
jgi:hypothetical protein